MQKTNIVVLDYAARTVTFYNNVEIDPNYDAEHWLANNTDYRMSDINWMSCDDEISIIYE